MKQTIHLEYLGDDEDYEIKKKLLLNVALNLYNFSELQNNNFHVVKKEKEEYQVKVEPLCKVEPQEYFEEDNIETDEDNSPVKDEIIIPQAQKSNTIIGSLKNFENPRESEKLLVKHLLPLLCLKLDLDNSQSPDKSDLKNAYLSQLIIACDQLKINHNGSIMKTLEHLLRCKVYMVKYNNIKGKWLWKHYKQSWISQKKYKEHVTIQTTQKYQQKLHPKINIGHSNNIIKCQVCGFTTSEKKFLTRHIKTKH